MEGAAARVRFGLVRDDYCASARLVVEIDGAGHDRESRRTQDKRRDRWLGENRIRVLRTPASELLNDEAVERMLVNIEQAAAPSTASRSPSPALRAEEELKTVTLCECRSSQGEREFHALIFPR